MIGGKTLPLARPYIHSFQFRRFDCTLQLFGGSSPAFSVFHLTLIASVSNPLISIALIGGKALVDSFFNQGPCLYGNYCGKKCKNKDGYCKAFTAAGGTKKAFDALSSNYELAEESPAPTVCKCKGKVQSGNAKCAAKA